MRKQAHLRAPVWCFQKRAAVLYCQVGPALLSDFGNVYGCDVSSSSSNKKCGYRGKAPSIFAAYVEFCSTAMAFGGEGEELGFGSPPFKCVGGSKASGFGPSEARVAGSMARL